MNIKYIVEDIFINNAYIVVFVNMLLIYIIKHFIPVHKKNLYYIIIPVICIISSIFLSNILPCIHAVVNTDQSIITKYCNIVYSGLLSMAIYDSYKIFIRFICTIYNKCKTNNI
jgi:hypothetical protein